MLNPPLDHLSTKALIQRNRLATFALIVVGLGATFAIGAAIYKWYTTGFMPETTLYTAIWALIAALPVFLQKKRITQLLGARMLNS